MTKRLLVVGGVAAGASAAAKARRTNEDVEIVIYEKGPYVSYGNCGIPYYIGGEIPSRDDLFLVTEQRFWDRLRIDVRVNHEVTEIKPDQSTVQVAGPDGSFEDHYDRLILATGAVPLRPPIPGIDSRGIHTLWTIPDGDAILDMVKTLSKDDPVCVVGGGFIGLEIAENLHRRGFQITLVEKMDQVMPPLDREMAYFASEHMRSKGIRVILSDGVSSFEGRDGTVESVVLESGEEIAAALVVLSIGVRPETSLAEKAQLHIGPNNGVEVDSYMRTSDPHIYAAGDMVETNHCSGRCPVRIPLAGPANKQGSIAGHNAAADLHPEEPAKEAFRGVLGTSIVRVFDLTVAATGLNERAAAALDYAVQVSHTISGHHADYYPGAQDMIIKLIADANSGRLLGGQAVGFAGVDKRIDVLATALMADMTPYDLEQLDLAYAPPYSAAKDPIIVAGMVAANVMRGQYRLLTLDDLEDGLDGCQIIDVRRPDEFEQGHLPGAVNYPIDEFRSHIGALDDQKPILLYCAVGQRAYTAYRILQNHGFSNLYSLSGGYELWSGTLGDSGRSENG